MKARLIGPLLMIALGATLLAGLGGGAAVDAGATTPCTTIPPQAAIIDPCSTTTTSDPCGPQVGLVNPCTTTTIDPCETQTLGAVQPCTTTTVTEVTTSTVATTDPPAVDGTTTEPAAALPDSATSVPPASSAAAAGELVRTGSDNGPLTVAGISLVVLGAGLAIYERRNAARRSA